MNKNNKLKRKIFSGKNKKPLEKKISLEEKKNYIINFVYNNIKYLNANIIIEEFESDYSSEEEIELLDDNDEELISN